MHKITGTIMAVATATILFTTSALAEWEYRPAIPFVMESSGRAETLAHIFSSGHVQMAVWECRDKQTMYLVFKQGVWPTMQGPEIRARLSDGREIAPLWLPGWVVDDLDNDGLVHVVQVLATTDEWPDWMANAQEMHIDAHFQRLGWQTLNIPLNGLASKIASYCG